MIIVGARMQYRHDQSTSVHDFDLHYADGTVAAVEVTASVAEQMECTAAAIANARKGGPFVCAKKCRHGWWVHPLPSANINKIRTHVDEYLAAIEAEGHHRFLAATDAASSPAVARILSELRIEAANVVQWKTPNCIGIALPGQGGLVSAENVQRAIEVEANKRDNRQKLARADVGERHLFIYIDPRNFLPRVACIDESPPQPGPSLPHEITHIWAAAQTRSADKFMVWKAERGKNWQCLGAVAVSSHTDERGSN
ncbi:MAG: hypothetical protein O7E52_21260 [Candidatus Poribacteria bacterium]|nr:hypothetical protein [Candidatus Poribacteria bacterium]